MPPRAQRGLSASQGISLNRVQSASGVARSATNTTAPKVPTVVAAAAAAKQPPRASVVSKSLTVTGNARSDMEALFERFLSRDRVDGVDAFGMNGIYRLCGELEIEPDSFEMYALIWKMGVTRGGCIPRADWLKTMYTYKIDQPQDLKKILVEWVKEARGDAFKEFYNALYDYIRGEEARLMPCGTAVKAWGVLFQRAPRIEQWINWCSTVYKRDVSRDLWREIEAFLSTVPNNEAYSAEDKWPYVIGDYVEWCKASS
ncbi:DCN1-like protein 2 [Trypanosoma conorhini]|uniref:Defective in cullin neddylation protein n=1 Tax=Trypanosoma conorhini TaxID=83891 RepID=A0A3R7N771_9TRYP|nr:DCN1-like protein 2 [Trypanosoma conorhini]RNF26563.1 DCN1-like protein 2 [Trypanosoma conorhini]